MARRKNQPESVRVKCHLSERLREVRTELFGERGGSEMVRRLGLPIRTWYNYEGGVTVPAEVLLRFIELTSVEPLWLLHGKGPKFRSSPVVETSGESDSVESLLRTALRRLERKPQLGVKPIPALEESFQLDGDGLDAENVVLIHIEPSGQERLTGQSGPRYIAARREWMEAQRDCRCVRVEGDDMAPMIANGAYVAFSDDEEDIETLDGQLVVAWVDNRPLVRWFGRSNRYGLLRAENPASDPGTLLIDLTAPSSGPPIRRVLWICTPH